MLIIGGGGELALCRPKTLNFFKKPWMVNRSRLFLYSRRVNQTVC